MSPTYGNDVIKKNIGYVSAICTVLVFCFKNHSKLMSEKKVFVIEKNLWNSGLMPYPCSQFCADINFDNRFNIKLRDSFHVNHTINFGSKLRSYGIV